MVRVEFLSFYSLTCLWHAKWRPEAFYICSRSYNEYLQLRPPHTKRLIGLLLGVGTILQNDRASLIVYVWTSDSGTVLR